jgi:hypothetical protein
MKKRCDGGDGHARQRAGGDGGGDGDAGRQSARHPKVGDRIGEREGDQHGDDCHHPRMVVSRGRRLK